MNKVNREDVFYAIVVGLMATTISGLTSGIVDGFLYQTAGFSLHLVFIIAVYFTCSYIRRQYEVPHITFTIIAFVMILLGMLLNDLSTIIVSQNLSPSYWFPLVGIVFSPVYIFTVLNPLTYFGQLNGVIEGLFVVLYFYLAYRYTN